MNPSQYTVVTSDDFGKFEDRVNELLEKGWTPQGGVDGTPLPASGKNLLHIQWSQAMVLPATSAALEVVEEELAEPVAEVDEIPRPPDTGGMMAGR